MQASIYLGHSNDSVFFGGGGKIYFEYFYNVTVINDFLWVVIVVNSKLRLCQKKSIASRKRRLGKRGALSQNRKMVSHETKNTL